MVEAGVEEGISNSAGFTELGVSGPTLKIGLLGGAPAGGNCKSLGGLNELVLLEMSLSKFANIS